jgi:thioredoxin reductase
MVELADGARVAARKLLLATGVVDELPDVAGMAELWGRGVLHCPYCHGWEVRDQPLAVYGRGEPALMMGLLIANWSRDLVICTDGPAELGATERTRLAALEIGVVEEPIARLEGTGGSLERIVFAGGQALARRAIFVRTQQRQRAPCAIQLGCALTQQGTIQVDAHGRISVPGVYAAGDAARQMYQQLIAAASDGCAAAIAINAELLHDDVGYPRAP